MSSSASPAGADRRVVRRGAKRCSPPTFVSARYLGVLRAGEERARLALDEARPVAHDPLWLTLVSTPDDRIAERADTVVEVFIGRAIDDDDDSAASAMKPQRESGC